MNLQAMIAEVQAHGGTQDPSRITQWINDAIQQAAARADYYIDEATLDFSTVAGTSTYPQPTDLGTDRSLHFTGTDQTGELTSVGLRTLDRSVASSGVPRFYALSGSNLQLYPTPDNVYTLELRYWKQPALLANPGDTTTIPDRYDDMLVYHALFRAYAAEDDLQTAQGWQQQWTTRLAEFAADVKYPNNDQPVRIADYWTGPPSAGSGLWTRWW